MLVVVYIFVHDYKTVFFFLHKLWLSVRCIFVDDIVDVGILLN